MPPRMGRRRRSPLANRRRQQLGETEHNDNSATRRKDCGVHAEKEKDGYERDPAAPECDSPARADPLAKPVAGGAAGDAMIAPK